MKVMALVLAEQNEEGRDAHQRKKEYQEAEQRHEKMNPIIGDGATLEQLGNVTQRQGMKMGVIELRKACKVRGLDDTGMKPMLVQRLSAHIPNCSDAPKAMAEAPKMEEPKFGTQALVSRSDAASTYVGEAITLLKSIKKQIKNYRSEASPDFASSPLEWWRVRQAEYPLLAPLARDLLAMPGSTAALERTFSHAGFIWEKRRGRIDPRLGSGILFCHANIQMEVF